MSLGKRLYAEIDDDAAQLKERVQREMLQWNAEEQHVRARLRGLRQDLKSSIQTEMDEFRKLTWYHETILIFF